MPSKQQHLAQAQRNRAFADSVDRDEYPDWVAVAWFYSALHLADALLADALTGRMAHPTNHVNRMAALATTQEWEQHPALAERYRTLDTLSRRARYACRPDSALFSADRLEIVYREDFLPLVAILEKLLS